MNEKTTLYVSLTFFAGVILFLTATMTGYLNLGGGGGGAPNNQTTSSTSQSPSPVDDIGDIFHVWVDPIYPSGLNNSKTLCLLSGGDWMDEVGGIGCFNMPTGTYNESQCLTDPTINYFEYTCEHGISDAEWICDARNIGCRRD